MSSHELFSVPVVECKDTRESSTARLPPRFFVALTLLAKNRSKGGKKGDVAASGAAGGDTERREPNAEGSGWQLQAFIPGKQDSRDKCPRCTSRLPGWSCTTARIFHDARLVRYIFVHIFVSCLPLASEILATLAARRFNVKLTTSSRLTLVTSCYSFQVPPIN